MTRSTRSVSAVLAEKQREATLFEWVIEKCRLTFVRSIPSDSIRDMQPTYMYTFGAIAHALYFSCLLFFAVTGYQNAINRRYVSLENSNGQCDPVLKPVTGTYYASHDGYWAGHSHFEYSDAMYVLDLRKFIEPTHRYQYYMSNVADQLHDLSLMAVTEPLVPNLLYWMAWDTSFTPQQGRANLFHMSGNVLEVMDREYMLGSMATVDKECPLTPLISYDRSNGVISMIYSAAEFGANGTCANMFQLWELGYRASYDMDRFEIAIDVRSAIVAIAVNMHVISLSSLEVVKGSNTSIILENTLYTLTFRYLPRYVGMAPILCAESADGTMQGCYLRVGRTFGLPVLNHFGDYYADHFPEPCICESENWFEYCEVFDLMLDVIVYNDMVHYTDYYVLLLYQMRSYRETSDLAYHASVYANTHDNFNATIRTKAYDFCVIGNYTCKILNFNVFDGLNTRVSEYYYQLHDGHCTNTFTTKSWHMLQQTPPTQLTEEYFECRATWSEALVMGVGLAKGNTNTLVPLVMLCMLPALYLIMHCVGAPPHKELYTDAEVAAANRAFGTYLLKAFYHVSYMIIRRRSEMEMTLLLLKAVYCDNLPKLVAASQAENGIVIDNTTARASLHDVIFTMNCNDITPRSVAENREDSCSPDDVETSGIAMNPLTRSDETLLILNDDDGRPCGVALSYQEGCDITKAAQSINRQFMSREQQLEEYVAFSNRLCNLNLSSSLQQNECSVSEVSRLHTDAIAYQFADRCYTASELLRLSLGQ